MSNALKHRVQAKNQKNVKAKSTLAKPVKKPKKTNVPVHRGPTPMVAAAYKLNAVSKLRAAPTHVSAAVPASAAEMAGRYGSVSKTSQYAASIPRGVTQFREMPHKAAKIALGNPNKVGSAINRIRAPKNLHSAGVGADSNARSKIEKLMSKVLSPDQMLSPDGRRYCELLQSPLTAEWGDEGEQQVKPLLYDSIVPPSATKTVRAFGQLQVSTGGLATTTQPIQAIWLNFAAGPGNVQVAPAGPVDASPGSDTIEFAHPIITSGGATGLANRVCCTPGAPPDGRITGGTAITNGGAPVAGYWYTTTNPNGPPSVDTAVGGTIDLALAATNGVGAAFGANNLFGWGSPVPLGDMLPDQSSAYKYRPVAFGIQITPVDAELSVGGAYNVSIIPQATNDAFVGTPQTPGNGDGISLTVNDFYALPDHKIERADGTLTAAWLPGRMDYSFYQTHAMTSAANVFTPVAGKTTTCSNIRFFVQIVPPANSQIHSYVVTYVGFYEIAGQCVEETGIVPRPQPSLGAKVATTVQNALYNEIDDRTTSITKGAAFEVAKDHPQIGPMIEEAKSPEEAKSIFSEVLDFGKQLLPLAGLLL